MKANKTKILIISVVVVAVAITCIIYLGMDKSTVADAPTSSESEHLPESTESEIKENTKNSDSDTPVLGAIDENSEPIDESEEYVEKETVKEKPVATPKLVVTPTPAPTPEEEVKPDAPAPVAPTPACK